MKINVITLFPDALRDMTDVGVTGKAIADGRVTLEMTNPRDFAEDRHRTVDDRPYGGGPGMVMKIEPLRSAIRSVKASATRDVPVSMLSPQGCTLDQAAVSEMAEREELILVCGRYEGVDERLVEMEIDEEWSIGDYVISGGELAAAVLIDAVCRLQPGVLGDEASAEQDSFSNGLLDCPHYTRPEDEDGLTVPVVLLSGDHEAIRRWRRKQSLGRTWQRRPDLLNEQALGEEDRLLLEEFRRETEHD
ncbi:MAG: tRNA (guanosine(37)-N1)-methyltransferase TrmD [Gammaproteobacteria bacterium]|nr:tRNA (guanosine(37)-N1)-methyltransferase TrmD [Gammaproteobacteria bacterium]NNE05941.1 tRNA (guanosine(37)-N1)-methyltransferase TrmD [Xanthomonadales bacterium]